MLVHGGVAVDASAARAMARRAVESGAAAETMRKLIAAQHGDPRVVDDTSLLPRAPLTVVVRAEQRGFVVDVDPLELALASVELGAGRVRAEQPVDHAVGLVLDAVVGDAVEVGAPLVTIHARDEAAARRIEARVRAAVRLGQASASRGPLVIETIRPA
jgi:pyrimidine-nucleoside phosphorylase